MSLNQIIDKDPLAPLVVDETLKLKAESLRVASYVSAESFILPSASADVLLLPYTIVYWDGSAERAVTMSAGSATGNLRIQKIARLATIQMPTFEVASAAVAGTGGQLRVKFTTALPAKFHPIGGNLSAPLCGRNNGATTSSPMLFVLNTSNQYFSIYSNYAFGNITTGITGTSTINAGIEQDLNICYQCA